MKLFVILASVALAQAAKLVRSYLTPYARAAAGSDFLGTPRESTRFLDESGSLSNVFAETDVYAQTDAFSSLESRPDRGQAAFERNAAILNQEIQNAEETYAYAYETENGISAEEHGVASNGVKAQGSYSFIGVDGQIYSVRYTADENGFQPKGDHLPISSPIPEEILKALEQNARDEAAGIYDDGSYREGKYANEYQQQYYNADAIVTDNALLVPKAYIPPFAQHNNHRSGARQFSFNNAVPRYDASESVSPIYGVQKAYLPPVARRHSFIARDG
ncbi:uncharacterized protein LOC135117872 [Helicoverpa armigera]|uniref:uncharacterized protein LOC135117872 n=1 Tax=Helicoverpa armigera TaxID=29058 RepID=UPI003082A9D1